MSIKDKIRIEDLTLHEPIWTFKREKGKCSICKSLLIFIVLSSKDNVWLCVDHWGYHKADKHNFISSTKL